MKLKVCFPSNLKKETPLHSVQFYTCTGVQQQSVLHSCSPCRPFLLLQTILDIQMRDSVNTFLTPAFKYEIIIVLYFNFHPPVAEPALAYIQCNYRAERSCCVKGQNESLSSFWCDINLAGEHVVVCVSTPKRPAPHNRKQRGEARVYGLIRPQRSLLF